MSTNSSNSSSDSDSPMVTKPRKGKGVLLVEVPIVYEFEFDYDDIDLPNQHQQQPPPPEGALSSELIAKARGRTLTTTKSLGTSETFDFTLPDGCNPMNDEVTRNLSQSIPSVCKKNYWLPLAQRLKGWKCETRQRFGGRCDKFYQHERSKMQQFRSFKDVKRYIYLGFLPATTLIQEGEKFLDLHLYISQQPDPKIS